MCADRKLTWGERTKCWWKLNKALHHKIQTYNLITVTRCTVQDLGPNKWRQNRPARV
jgi:hypothetical protein